MNYNTSLVSNNITKQTQGTYPSPKTDGVTTEIYPETGNNGIDEGIKVDIITTTNEGKDYLKLDSQSIYTIANYKFSFPIKSKDKVAIKILAKLSKHSLKLHSDTYKAM